MVTSKWVTAQGCALRPERSFFLTEKDLRRVGGPKGFYMSMQGVDERSLTGKNKCVKLLAVLIQKTRKGSGGWVKRTLVRGKRRDISSAPFANDFSEGTEKERDVTCPSLIRTKT